MREQQIELGLKAINYVQKELQASVSMSDRLEIFSRLLVLYWSVNEDLLKERQKVWNISTISLDIPGCLD